MNWLDFGLIIFAVIFLIIGLKRGFMTTILSSFSFSINLILSFFLCKPAASLLNGVFNLEGSIAGHYSSKLIQASSDFSINLLDISQNDLGSFVSNTINKSGLPDFANRLTNLFLNNSSLYSTLHESSHTSRTLADIMSSAYANFFTTIISFVTCVVLIYIIVWILGLIVNKLRTIGFIKVVDNILGLFYGLFRCFLVLIIISLVIKLMSPLSFMSGVISYINSSAIGKFIYGQLSSFIDNYLNFSDILKLIFK